MNAPYRSSSTRTSEHRYGPFPFPWWSPFVLCSLFMFTWAMWRKTRQHTQLECASDTTQGQCVYIRTHARNRVDVHTFPSRSLDSVHLQETKTKQGQAVAAIPYVQLKDFSSFALTEMPIDTARDLAYQLETINVGPGLHHVSFHSAPQYTSIVLAAMGLIAFLLVSRYLWVRRSAVRLRWTSDTRSLEVIDPGFFGTRHTTLTVPTNATFHVNWRQGFNGTSPTLFASLDMQLESKQRIRLTRERPSGMGVHSAALVMLQQHLDHDSLPTPAPTTAFSWASNGLFCFFIGFASGMILGTGVDVMLSVETGALPFGRLHFRPLPEFIAIAMFTTFMFVMHRKERNDHTLYQQLTYRHSSHA